MNQFKVEIVYIEEISQTENLVTEAHSFITNIKKFGVQGRVSRNLSIKYKNPAWSIFETMQYINKTVQGKKNNKKLRKKVCTRMNFMKLFL